VKILLDSEEAEKLNLIGLSFPRLNNLEQWNREVFSCTAKRMAYDIDQRNDIFEN